MKRLRSVWAWVCDRWPFALRSTTESLLDVIDGMDAQIKAEQRKTQVATDLLIAEKRRREMLSSTLDSLAIMKGFGPKATEDVAS